MRRLLQSQTKAKAKSKSTVRTARSSPRIGNPRGRLTTTPIWRQHQPLARQRQRRSLSPYLQSAQDLERKERLPNGHTHLASASATHHAPASTIPGKGEAQVHSQGCLQLAQDREPKKRSPNDRTHLASTSATRHAPAPAIPDKGKDEAQVHISSPPRVWDGRWGCQTAILIWHQHQLPATCRLLQSPAKAESKSTSRTAHSPPRIGDATRCCSTTTPIWRQHQSLATRRLPRAKAKVEFKSTFRNVRNPSHRKTGSGTQEEAAQPHPFGASTNYLPRPASASPGVQVHMDPGQPAARHTGEHDWEHKKSLPNHHHTHSSPKYTLGVAGASTNIVDSPIYSANDASLLAATIGNL